ncbi:MAG TPA: hypothetical protein PKH43_11930 [Saprospiraceae bacterium]|nr:hypothetical protein [Saprospiraceae bacterium]
MTKTRSTWVAALFLLVAQASTAQITLTSANMPGAGLTFTSDEVESSFLSSLNIGAAGPNQTWNFSNAPTIDFPQPQYYLAPASTPFAASFPTSNLAFTDELSDTADYNYLLLNNSGMSQLGLAGGTGNLNLNPALKLFQLPFTYQNSFNSTSQASGTSEGLSVSGTYSTDVVADAYGTVTTQLGTFPCLRIKRISELNLTVLFFSVIQKDTTYEWWTTQYKSPVFSYTRNSTDVFGQLEYGSFANVLIEQAVPVSEPDASQSLALQAAPNPTTGASTISFELSRPGKTDLLVVDATGKTVANYALGTLGAGQYNQEVQLGSAPAGVYVAFLRQEGQLLGMKQLVKE